MVEAEELDLDTTTAHGEQQDQEQTAEDTQVAKDAPASASETPEIAEPVVGTTQVLEAPVVPPLLPLLPIEATAQSRKTQTEYGEDLDL